MQTPSISSLAQPRAAENASILLEVVLAMALFVAAATIIGSGLNASIDATRRLREEFHAANLAVSVMSEMSMAIRPVENGGPEPFTAPFEAWTWQIETAPLDETSADAASLRRVEVVVRNPSEGVVHRLAQFFPASSADSSDQANPVSSAPVE